MNTVAIIQGRMSSRRLPGKVLMDLGGKPMLARVIARARAANVFDLVMVATSVDPTDDAIAAYCSAEGIACFRGDLNDVLGRYGDAAKTAGADVIARITADCPLLDPAVVRAVVRAFDPQQYDYVSNILERTYPKGLDIEVLSMSVLERMTAEATSAYDREHVTTYIRDGHDTFRTHNVAQKENHSALRWTVDEPADLAHARAIYAKIDGEVFGQDAILAMLEQHPELSA